MMNIIDRIRKIIQHLDILFNMTENFHNLESTEISEISEVTEVGEDSEKYLHNGLIRLTDNNLWPYESIPLT